MPKWLLISMSEEHHRAIKTLLAKHGVKLKEFGEALANHIDKTEEIVKAFAEAKEVEE